VKCEAYFTGLRQFRMEPRADLEQRSNPPLHLDLPRTLRRNRRKNLEQSRFACTIPPDDAKDLPPLHLKRNILQRIDPIRRRSLRRDERPETRAFGSDFSSEERGAFAERISDVFSESDASSLVEGFEKAAPAWPPKHTPAPPSVLSVPPGEIGVSVHFLSF
jgi:hypothetical protein